MRFMYLGTADRSQNIHCVFVYSFLGGPDLETQIGFDLKKCISIEVVLYQGATLSWVCILRHFELQNIIVNSLQINMS